MPEFMDKTQLFSEEEQERVRQILKAVEGLSVFQPQSLLKTCESALAHVTVRYN